MPVPSLITDLTPVAATNSPAGSESPGTADDYFRAHAAFIAQLRAVIGGTADANIPSALVDGSVTTAKLADGSVTLAKMANSASNLGVGQFAKNKIINGNFQVNQRAVSGTVVLAAGIYGHDRFKAGASGCTYTFASSGGVITLTIIAGSLVQVVEGENLTAGTHTLSWGGTAQGKIGGGSYSVSGVSASVTGGANLNVEFNTGTLSRVQLEVGAVSTPFEHRPYGDELALCQRYGERVTTGWITGFSAAISVLNLQWRVPKRVVPTLTLVAGGVGVGNGISIDITAISSVTASVDGAFMALTGGVAWTAAASYSWRVGSIFVSSEL